MARRKPTPPPAPTAPEPPRPAVAPPASESTGRPPETERDRPAPAGQPRRRFVIRLWALLGGAALGELAWITGSFLRPRQHEAALASLFVAGPVERFEPGSVTAFPAGRFYLVRLNEGGFIAAGSIISTGTTTTQKLFLNP